jgi:hypothetical protein
MALGSRCTSVTGRVNVVTCLRGCRQVWESHSISFLASVYFLAFHTCSPSICMRCDDDSCASVMCIVQRNPCGSQDEMHMLVAALCSKSALRCDILCTRDATLPETFPENPVAHPKTPPTHTHTLSLEDHQLCCKLAVHILRTCAYIHAAGAWPRAPKSASRSQMTLCR